MSNTRPNNTTKVIIDNEEKALDKNGEVHEQTFKVSTNGYPLLSGIVNKPVTVEQKSTGQKFSGNVDDIIAAMNNRRPGM